MPALLIVNVQEDRGGYYLKPVFLLLYIHGKSTVVTIISKRKGICMYIKKCTEFSLEILSTVRVAKVPNGGLRLLK